MADNIADDLLIKVGIKVDDSQYTDLKKDFQKNKNQSLKLKPDQSFSPIPGADVQQSFVKNLYQGNLKDSKKLLQDIISDQSNKNSERFGLSKDKAQEYLSKILEVERKQENSLENLLEKENQKNSDQKQADTFSTPSVLGLITGILTAGYFLEKQIQQRYVEKLEREMNLASLSYQTGQTVDQMAKLNYQAKNVGLSLDQVVHNAQNFTSDLFFGQNDQKAMMFAALGVNPLDQLKGIKTPEDAINLQNSIQKQITNALISGGFPAFLATQQASQLSGIPQSQAFAYQNLNSAKNINLANDIQQARGSIGNRETVINNFEDITASLQKSVAEVDKLLSTGDIAKRIAIQNAEIQATTVKLINATINLTGVADKNSSFSKIFSAEGGEDLKKNYNWGKPSSSSQVKAGGG